jgi:hypothetical protein
VYGCACECVRVYGGECVCMAVSACACSVGVFAFVLWSRVFCIVDLFVAFVVVAFVDVCGWVVCWVGCLIVVVGCVCWVGYV